MKQPNTRSIMSAFAVLIFAMTSSTAGFSSEVKPLERQARFETENQQVHQDLLWIYMHRGHIRSLKTKMKYDRAERNKNEVEKDKKELKKCRTDLRDARHELRTSKRNLRKAYRFAINVRKNLIRQDKRLIRDCRKMQRKDNEQNYATANEKLVIMYNKDLATDKYSLQQIRSERASNLFALNKDIRRLNGEFFLLNYAEGGMTGISNWMRK
jgi:hypothetical protein